MFSEMHHVANVVSLLDEQCLEKRRVNVFNYHQNISKRYAIQNISKRKCLCPWYHYTVINCLSIPLLFEPFQSQVFLDHDFFCVFFLRRQGGVELLNFSKNCQKALLSP